MVQGYFFRVKATVKKVVKFSLVRAYFFLEKNHRLRLGVLVIVNYFPGLKTKLKQIASARFRILNPSVENLDWGGQIGLNGKGACAVFEDLQLALRERVRR